MIASCPIPDLGIDPAGILAAYTTTGADLQIETATDGKLLRFGPYLPAFEWLIRKAGLARVSGTAVVSLEKAVRLKPQTGEIVFHVPVAGDVLSRAAIAPNFWPQIVAQVKAARWIAADGVYLNPAHGK